MVGSRHQGDEEGSAGPSRGAWVRMWKGWSWGWALRSKAMRRDGKSNHVANSATTRREVTYRVSGARELLEGDEQLARVFFLLPRHPVSRCVDRKHDGGLVAGCVVGSSGASVGGGSLREAGGQEGLGGVGGAGPAISKPDLAASTRAPPSKLCRAIGEGPPPQPPRRLLLSAPFCRCTRGACCSY